MKRWIVAMSLLAACGPAITQEPAAQGPVAAAGEGSGSGSGSGSDEQECHEERVIGSMMTHEVCRPKADVDAEREQLTDKLRATSVRPGASPSF